MHTAVVIPSVSFSRPRELCHLSDSAACVRSGQKQETDKFEQCSAAVFDKMMLFECNCSAKEFQQGTIKIEAYSYNSLGSNDLIGDFTFGVGGVNMKPDHMCASPSRVALSAPSCCAWYVQPVIDAW